VASQLARVEVPAAIWRKHRIGELPAAVAGILVAAFEADYFGADGEPPRFAVVKATSHILDQAARLVAAHGLPAYDAVQLASACVVNAAVPEGVAFLAFDKALCSAAAAEGLELPPAGGRPAPLPSPRRCGSWPRPRAAVAPGRRSRPAPCGRAGARPGRVPGRCARPGRAPPRPSRRGR
jgi:predicted nucleic acid-binding protein